MEEGSGVEVETYEEIVRSDSHLNLMNARPPSPSTVSAFQATICDPITKGRSDSTVLSTSVPWPALRHELAWELGKSRGGLRPKRTGFHDGNIPSRTEVGRKLFRDTIDMIA